MAKSTIDGINLETNCEQYTNLRTIAQKLVFCDAQIQTIQANKTYWSESLCTSLTQRQTSWEDERNELLEKYNSEIKEIFERLTTKPLLLQSIYHYKNNLYVGIHTRLCELLNQYLPMIDICICFGAFSTAISLSFGIVYLLAQLLADFTISTFLIIAQIGGLFSIGFLLITYTANYVCLEALRKEVLKIAQDDNSEELTSIESFSYS